jgi:hypothetical protein
MVELANDPERRIFFGKNARFGFEQRFTIKRMSDEYEAVYRQCLISNFEIRN